MTEEANMHRMTRVLTPLLILGAVASSMAITCARMTSAAPSTASSRQPSLGIAATTPAASPAGRPTDPRRAQIKQLDDQIRGLREQFHAQLDPLELQVKALRDKFDPQIKSLEQEVERLRQQFADERKEIHAKYDMRRKQLRGGMK